jgi:tetratricopeptide (TPR) repeat protein
MAITPKKIKFSTRRKKNEPTAPGIHSVPKEVVEIERNLIENWLISLKQWFQFNIEFARKIILGIIIFTLLVFISVFLHSAVIDKQNSDFYRLLITYDNLEKSKSENKNYNNKIKTLKESADKLCKARWSTQYSNSGCLVSSIISNEMGEFQAAAESLKKFSDKTSNTGFSSYSSLVAGYLFEKTSQIDTSIKLYKKILDNLEDITGKDIALFHYGRLLYHNKQFKEAEKSFQEIIDNHKNSIYLQKSRQYLLLISIDKT